MNDIEYDIIDELYFVTAYPDLAQALNLPEAELHPHLAGLIQQGLVKTFYPDPDTEIAFDEEGFRLNFPSYFFLATKAGLIRHNSR
ncbi:MAG: hypothetical protein JWQ14_1763 [Adhaeribacter sp.]|nr:hypothetical protein [Adhaeribacter sp.]